MEQAILEDRNYEPKKEDFIDKIPETIPEEDESVSKEPDKDKSSSMYIQNIVSLIKSSK
jgi:hypothetical protein